MGHVILLGDSIFDNARYVPGQPDVVAQLRDVLPAGWKATLLARDGAVTGDVARQIVNVPRDATHLVLSAGGNNALQQSGVEREPVHTVGEALGLLADVRERFARDYWAMLDSVTKPGLPLIICTIYDAIPDLGREDRTALALFNEVILREAAHRAISVVDLRLVCPSPRDYSDLSSIEPSYQGGAKIAAAVARAVAGFASANAGCMIFV